MTAVALLFISVPAAAEPDYSKDPVVMVHGYFLWDVPTWAWMKARLIEEGWPPEYIYVVAFENDFGCNPKHAQEVKAVVDQALAETGRDKVDMVCHSMGCLDTRYYIKFMCGYQHVQDVVNIAGANQGSVVACAEPFSCGADQMCVGPLDDAWMKNDFLFKLNICDMTPGDGILYTCIWTPLDEIIVPAKNGELAGALNIKLTAPVEHALILMHEETASYVIPGLDGSGKNSNMPTTAPPCYTVCEESGQPDSDQPEAVESTPDVIDSPEPLEETIEAPDLMPTPDTTPGPDLPAASVDSGGKRGDPPSGIDTTGEIIGKTDVAAPTGPQPSYQLPAPGGDGCSTDGSGGSVMALLLLLGLLLLFSRLISQRGTSCRRSETVPPLNRR